MIAIVVTVLLLIYLFMRSSSSSSEGGSPFGDALKAGNIKEAEKIIALLVKLKAINTHGHEGLTPLHYAALHDQQAIAEKLLAYGADIHCQTEVAKKESEEPLNVPVGFTALQIAEQHGHQEMSDFLLAQGANT